MNTLNSQIIRIAETVFDFQRRFATFVYSDFVLDLVDAHSFSHQNLLLLLHRQIHIFQGRNSHSSPVNYSNEMKSLEIHSDWLIRFVPIILISYFHMR